MKKLFFIVFSVFILAGCDKPDILEREAKLKIENTSTSDYITGVYYGTVGPGTQNRISKNIGPGESVTFSVDIKDDSMYDIKVTCDNSEIGDFSVTHHDFSWNETYIIELTSSGWYDDEIW